MNILFLCTANSCRSILSEAVLNQRAPADIRAFSAGSQPRGEVNPLTLAALRRHGIESEGLASKSIDSLSQLNPDIVITVCDKAAGEACPVFFGTSIKAHWGLADPSELRASEQEMERAFDQTLSIIEARVAAFLALPFDQLDPAALKAELVSIGAIEDQSCDWQHL